MKISLEGFSKKYSFSPSFSSSAYAPSGRLLATCHSNSLTLHNLVEGLIYPSIHILQEETENTPFIAFLSDKLLAHTSSPSNSTQLPPVTSSNSSTTACGYPIKVLDLEAGKYIRIFSNSTQTVSVSSSPSAQALLTVSERNIYFWDTRQKEPVAEMPSRKNVLCKYSPDGSVFTLLLPDTEEMKLFDLRSYEMGPYSSKRLLLQDPWKDFEYSWSGRRLLLTTEKEALYLNGISGKQIGSIQTPNISSICFSSDDQYIFYSSEKTLSACSAESLKPVFSWSLSSSISSLLYNPRYHQLSIASDTTEIWQDA